MLPRPRHILYNGIPDPKTGELVVGNRASDWVLAPARPPEARRWLGQSRVVLEIHLQLTKLEPEEWDVAAMAAAAEAEAAAVTGGGGEGAAADDAGEWMAAGLQLKCLPTPGQRADDRTYRVDIPFLAGRPPAATDGHGLAGGNSTSTGNSGLAVTAAPQAPVQPEFRRLALSDSEALAHLATSVGPRIGGAAAARRSRQSAHEKGWSDNRKPLLAWAISFDQSRGVQWQPPPPPEPPKLWGEPLALEGARPKAGLFVTVDGERWAVVSEVTASGNLRLKWWCVVRDCVLGHQLPLCLAC
eukprot:SAG22_NODE_774_length_7293_cov_15.888796_5_plen_300_part_00